MTIQTVTLTAENFTQEVLESDLPVLVDFWAAWCGPCRLIAPIVGELATDFSGRVKVAKLNIDEHPAIASQYHINAVPTLLYFENGRVVDSVIGVVAKARLAQKLNALLDKSTAQNAA